MMMLDAPDSPEVSFNQVLQVSRALQTLTDEVAIHSEEFGSDDTTPTWTAVNGRPSADTDHSEANGMHSDMDDEEVWSGQERDILFTFEHDLAFAQDVETGVYMRNAMAGSWCGRLQDDEVKDVEIQNLVALNHVRRARETVTALQRAAERQTVHPSAATAQDLDNTTTSNSDDDWTKKRSKAIEKDESLRTKIQLIKVMLRDNGVLTLQHTGAHDVDYNMNCKHPYCTSTDGYIPAHAYYVTLEMPGDAEFTCRYCITCFEDMWNGELLVGNLPDPRILKQTNMREADRCVCHDGVEDSKPEAGVESENDMFAVKGTCSCGKEEKLSLRLPSPPLGPPGSIPASLLTSKHAPKPEETTAHQHNHTTGFSNKRFEDSQPPLSAMRSTLKPSWEDQMASDSCGRFCPTRFQHLAHHIQPGEGLNEKEKATLMVWKAITEEQFRCMSLSPLYGSTSKMGQLEALGSGESVVEAMDVVGMDRILFYGRDLSEALFLVQAR